MNKKKLRLVNENTSYCIECLETVTFNNKCDILSFSSIGFDSILDQYNIVLFCFNREFRRKRVG